MKRAAKVVAAMLVLPPAGVFLLGCPKKATKTELTPEPRVSESIVTTRPGAGVPGAGGADGRGGAAGGTQQPAPTEEQRLAQLLASRGEDIPIKESPAMEFVEPWNEDKAVLKTIYFEYDKSNIRPEYQLVLEGIARWMAKQADRQLLIEGHCDERSNLGFILTLWSIIKIDDDYFHPSFIIHP